MSAYELETQFATEEGRVYASGLNDWGQLGLPLSTGHSMVCINFNRIYVIGVIAAKLDLSRILRTNYTNLHTCRSLLKSGVY